MATANLQSSGASYERVRPAVPNELLPTADMAESYDLDLAQALEPNPNNALITKLWLEMADIIGDHIY